MDRRIRVLFGTLATTAAAAAAFRASPSLGPFETNGDVGVCPRAGAELHRKALLMIRQPDARCADAALHGDGTSSLLGEAFQPAGPTVVILKDPVYVGLGISAHNAANLKTAVFSNVTLEVIH